MSEKKYYVFCDDDCKFESMTSEQILAAIAEATGNAPTSVDDAFITKIKELNKNGNLTFWKGTEAEFNALGVSVANVVFKIDANGQIYLVSEAGGFVEYNSNADDYVKKITVCSEAPSAEEQAENPTTLYLVVE